MSSPNFMTVVTDTTNLATSVSVDATFWMGQNLIRRAAVKATAVWPGTDTNLQNITVAAGTSTTPIGKIVDFGAATAMVAVQVSSPIDVKVTVNSVETSLSITSLLVLDGGVSKLVFSNPTSVAVQLQVISSM
jgi:hypothetical protein